MSTFENLVSVKMKSFSMDVVSETYIGEIDKKSFQKSGDVHLKKAARFLEYKTPVKQEIIDPNTKKKKMQDGFAYNMELLNDESINSDNIIIPKDEVKLVSFLDVDANKHLINHYSDVIEKMRMRNAGLHSPN